MGGSVVYVDRHEGRAPRGTILMGQDVSGMDRPTLTALVLQRAASVYSGPLEAATADAVWEL